MKELYTYLKTTQICVDNTFTIKSQKESEVLLRSIGIPAIVVAERREDIRPLTEEEIMIVSKERAMAFKKDFDYICKKHNMDVNILFETKGIIQQKISNKNFSVYVTSQDNITGTDFLLIADMDLDEAVVPGAINIDEKAHN